MYHKSKSESGFPAQNRDQPERFVASTGREEHLIYKKLFLWLLYLSRLPSQQDKSLLKQIHNEP